ncbi:MAG: tRNA-dihydrouridine synthase family protein [Candidatus Micrarchaeota archaeon]
MAYANFLAPIDGYTNLPFRLLCQKYGAIATCVPLVNSTAIARLDEKISFVDAHKDEKNIGVQLVGNNPEDIEKTARIVVEEKPFVKWLNLNCGCPSTRTRESGGGSALLEKPEIIVKSVLGMKKHHDNVSVKIRLRSNKKETLEICKKIQDAGAESIIVHGRTVKQGYSGNTNWEEIRYLKENLEIEVIGNGNIKTIEQGQKYVNEGYCHSFMIGRAAMVNPMLFNEKEITSRIAILSEYIRLHERYLGEVEVNDIKVKAVNFITGLSHASRLRDKICRAETVDNILELVEKGIIN